MCGSDRCGGSSASEFRQNAIQDEYLYGPYGSSRYSNGTLPTSIGFTGQQHDSVTGLDYYVSRYYDPVVGAFLSPDDVQGNEQGMNPYVYVKGNPETFIDPTGRCPFCVVLPFLAAVGEAVVDVSVAVTAVISAPVVITGVLIVGIIVLGALVIHNIVAAQQKSYEANDGKHKSKPRTNSKGQTVSAEPQNAEKVWENRENDAWKVPGDTHRWVGYDPETGEIIIFDDTNNGTVHSHVRTWGELTQAQKNVLIKHKVFKPTGKVNQSWVDEYFENQKLQQEEVQKQQEEASSWHQSEW